MEINRSKTYIKIITLIVITIMFGLIQVGCKEKNTNKYDVLVTANNSSYGTVSGGGTYKEGATATLKAKPNNDYFFIGWYKDNLIVSSDAVYKINVNKNIRLVAHFGIDTDSIGDFNSFVIKINKSFKEAVGIDTELVTKFGDLEEILISKGHLKNGSVEAAYIKFNEHRKLWVKDGIQYNYIKYGDLDKEVTKHSFIEDIDSLDTTYLYSYMIQLINRVLIGESGEYQFLYDDLTNLYILKLLDEVGVQGIDIKFKVEDDRLVQSNYDIYYGETKSMSLVEKISYEISDRPVLPEIEQHEYLASYWVTFQAPTGETTKHYEPVSKVPMYFGDEYFNEASIEGYYYDQAYTKIANVDDILKGDTVIYYKLKDVQKIDFIINFTNPNIEPIRLEQVYKGRIFEVKFTVPKDTEYDDFYNSMFLQLINLDINVWNTKVDTDNTFIFEIVMPNKSMTIVLD